MYKAKLSNKSSRKPKQKISLRLSKTKRNITKRVSIKRKISKRQNGGTDKTREQIDQEINEAIDQILDADINASKNEQSLIGKCKDNTSKISILFQHQTDCELVALGQLSRVSLMKSIFNKSIPEDKQTTDFKNISNELIQNVIEANCNNPKKPWDDELQETQSEMKTRYIDILENVCENLNSRFIKNMSEVKSKGNSLNMEKIQEIEEKLRNDQKSSNNINIPPINKQNEQEIKRELEYLKQEINESFEESQLINDTDDYKSILLYYFGLGDNNQPGDKCATATNIFKLLQLLNQITKMLVQRHSSFEKEGEKDKYTEIYGFLILNILTRISTEIDKFNGITIQNGGGKTLKQIFNGLKLVGYYGIVIPAKYLGIFLINTPIILGKLSFHSIYFIGLVIQAILTG